MVLSFSQEEKKRIESQGMMVIEFKHRIYKSTYVWENIWRVLKEWVNKACEIINVFVDSLWKNFSERAIELSERAIELVEMHVPKFHAEKYKPVTKYMKCNKPYTGVRRIDIRCRSRC